MDTRFSSAIHMLILVAVSDGTLTSEHIASSVGTNPSYIRKISCLLKKAGIIDSTQGVSGTKLLIVPEELSLYQIYCAVNESEQIKVFDLHQNPDDRCIIGKHIKPVLSGIFRGISDKAEQELRVKTLADCISEMKGSVTQAERDQAAQAGCTVCGA